LLAAYLTSARKICGLPALDREFKTIDFLTFQDLHSMPAKVAARIHELAPRVCREEIIPGPDFASVSAITLFLLAYLDFFFRYKLRGRASLHYGAGRLAEILGRANCFKS